jgi:hypothetical protein
MTEGHGILNSEAVPSIPYLPWFHRLRKKQSDSLQEPKMLDGWLSRHPLSRL